MSSRYLETIANILVGVAALALIATLVHREFFGRGTSTPPARPEPKVGQHVDLESVEALRGKRTLYFALQTTCRFCTESAPFYKRLIAKTKDSGVRFVAVFPTPVDESSQHLVDLGITEMQVVQASLDTLNVGGTPTLMLVDDTGNVIASWIGKLSADKEVEVIEKLKS